MDVTYTKCYLYQMLPTQNVTYTKCYLDIVYWTKMLLYENVLEETLLVPWACKFRKL